MRVLLVIGSGGGRAVIVVVGPVRGREVPGVAVRSPG